MQVCGGSSSRLLLPQSISGCSSSLSLVRERGREGERETQEHECWGLERKYVMFSSWAAA